MLLCLRTYEILNLGNSTDFSVYLHPCRWFAWILSSCNNAPRSDSTPSSSHRATTKHLPTELRNTQSYNSQHIAPTDSPKKEKSFPRFARIFRNTNNSRTLRWWIRILWGCWTRGDGHGRLTPGRLKFILQIGKRRPRVRVANLKPRLLSRFIPAAFLATDRSGPSG